jgi:hypothetical protein
MLKQQQPQVPSNQLVCSPFGVWRTVDRDMALSEVSRVIRQDSATLDPPVHRKSE